MLTVLAGLAVLAQAEAAAAAPGADPSWLRRPSSEDMVRHYPEAATKRGLSGRVVIVCMVKADGSLDPCRVDSELPKEAGFGEAALRMGPLFKMHPKTKSGESVGGGTVRIPLRFVLIPHVARQEKLLAAMSCYGQVANLAERKPKMTAAWQAVVYWSMEVAAASANSGFRPIDFEDALALGRQEDRERAPPAPDAELDACLAKGAPRKP